MKKLILLLLLLFPVYLMAQTALPPKTAVFFLDSVIVDKDKLMTIIKPDDILEIEILPAEKSQQQYQVERATFFTTKKAAVKQYKDIFSAVSVNYKKYMEANNNDDANITYYVNGVKIDELKDRIVSLRKASKLVQILSFKQNDLTADDKHAIATIITNKL